MARTVRDQTRLGDSQIIPIVHSDCCIGQQCVHVFLPKRFEQSPFAGMRCCIPVIENNRFSARSFIESTCYTSLIKNRIPMRDAKIGSRQMVPILRNKIGNEFWISLWSFRDVLYNISELWLIENSDPEEWSGGQTALDIWLESHLKYLLANAYDLGPLSRKVMASEVLKNRAAKEQREQKKDNKRRGRIPRRAKVIAATTDEPSSNKPLPVSLGDIVGHDGNNNNTSNISNTQIVLPGLAPISTSLTYKKKGTTNALPSAEVVVNQTKKNVDDIKSKSRLVKLRMGDEFVYQSKYPYERDLEIRTSTIPNAGQGVFAKQAFKKDQVIGRYAGRAISREQMMKLPKEDMNKIISINTASGGEKLIDGKHLKHYSAFFNHKWKVKGNPMGAANLTVFNEGIFTCLRAIQKGEELFFDYGPKYWAFQDFNIDVDEIEDTFKQLEIQNQVMLHRPN